MRMLNISGCKPSIILMTIAHLSLIKENGLIIYLDVLNINTKTKGKPKLITKEYFAKKKNILNISMMTINAAGLMQFL